MPDKKRNFDFVLKFGGSITEKGTIEQVQALSNTLSIIYSKKQNFLLVPGGGSFAEEVRRIQKQYKVSDELAHWMAILAMEQYALLLHHLLPESTLIEYSSKDFYKQLDSIPESKLPILSILNFMKNESKLTHDWNTTSDAIATEIALNLKISEIIYVKDVDGIMINNTIVERITIDDLENITSSPLDKITPSLLRKNSMTGYIVNGFLPSRLIDLMLDGKEIIGTKVVF